MRILLKAVVALAAVLALAFGAATWLVPEDLIRNQVAAVVKQQTGRTLAVRGETAFNMFPNVGVELSHVSLSNPPGMQGGAVLRMASLTVDLELWPLLTRGVEVKRFVLTRPIINLHVDKQGRRNWAFRKTAAADPGKPGKTARGDAGEPRRMMRAQAGGGLGGGMVRDIRLSKVRIEEGVLVYTDARSGADERFDAVNATLAQPDRSEPLEADGSLVWQGEKIAFNARLGALPALLRQAPSAVKLAVDTKHGKARFDGQLGVAPLEAHGDVSGDTPSVRALMGWLGSPLRRGGGLGKASVSGEVDMTGNTLTFSQARLSLDGMTGQGRATIRFRAPRPYVSAALALDRLDLNPYLRGAASTPRGEESGGVPERPAAPEAPTAGPGDAPEPKPDQSLTDFIEDLNRAEEDGQPQPAPQVRGWSERALDLAGLGAVDADLKLTAGALLYRDIETGKSAVTASLKDGLLTADLTRLTLYSGQGTGRVTVNGARDVPAVAAQFDLNGLSALPFLTDAADFEWISGNADIDFSLSGAGRSQSAIVGNLQGQGSLHFADGAIEGINIPAMVRGLKQGRLDGWRRDERAKTDFTELSGTFTMKNGVARNDDLEMVSPLLRVTGEGEVSLPRERLDYDIVPRIVASLRGQGGQEDLEGLAIPVRIKGHWSDPEFEPDLERLLEDPEMRRNAVDKAEKFLQGLLGDDREGDDGQQDGSGDGGRKEKAKELLQNLFR